MVTRGTGTELDEKTVFHNIIAALGQNEKDWGRRCSRLNYSAWKRKSKKLQNMEGLKIGIHMEILPSCLGYVSNCLLGTGAYRSWCLVSLFFAPNHSLSLLSLLLLLPVQCSYLKKEAGFSLYHCAWELIAARYA